MKILQINKYLNIKGGSEVVLENITKILTTRNHEVINLGFISDSEAKIVENTISLGQEKKSVLGMFFNKNLVDQIIGYIKEKKIDVVIFHNVYHHFPIKNLFKSINNQTNAKTITYLHDYKVVCPIQTLYNYRTGEVCEKCKDKRFYNIITNRCKEDSYLKSTVFSIDSYYNNFFKGAYSFIDKLVTPSKFTKDKINSLGFKLDVNILPNPINLGEELYYKDINPFSITYLGRMSQEKGVIYLLEIAKLNPTIEFNFVGSGKLDQSVILESQKHNNINYLGYVNNDGLSEIYKQATFVIVPSLCHEVFGLTTIEAMSYGTPIITTGYGGTRELVENGRGYFISSNDVNEASEQIKEIFKINKQDYKNLQNRCSQFAKKFSDENYFDKLVSIINDIDS